MSKHQHNSSNKHKSRRTYALNHYLKDPVIRELHNDTLALFRRTYGIQPSDKKMQGLIRQYGYKHVRYALLIVQQFHSPKKAQAFRHFKKTIARIFPSPEQVAKTRASR